MKKKPSQPSKKGLYIVIGIGVAIITLVVSTNYYVDQAKIAGQRFGNNLDQIQSELNRQTSDFDSKMKIWQEGGLTKDELLKISEQHLSELELIIKKYDELDPPQAFVSSVELFKHSTQAQLESDTFLKKWIETGDNSTKIKSDELMQQSFEYETSALASFNAAKRNYMP